METDIKHFFPELQLYSGGLYTMMIAVAAMIMLAGLIYRIAASGGDPGQMLRTVTTAGMIGIAIAMFSDWINDLQLIAYDLVDDTDADPSRSYQRFASLMGGASAQSDQEVGFWDILWSQKGGLGNAMVYAFMFCISKLSQAVMFLFFVVQQLLVHFQTALAPAFLAMFLIRSLSGAATQFMLRLVAVALWPVGWAIASVMTNALMDKAFDDVAGPIQTWEVPGFMPLLALWILISTIGAPLIIWKLLSGSATAGESLFMSVGSGLGQGLTYAVSGGMTASMMGGSSVASAAAATAGGVGGAVSGSLGGGGVLIPAAIGFGSAMIGSKPADSAPIDVNKRAAELAKK